MKRAGLLLATLLLAGCGGLQVDREALSLPQPWPLRQPPPHGVKEDRFSLLINTATTELPSELKDYDFHAIFACGIFSEVYRVETVGEKKPECSLTVSVSRNLNLHWYSTFGIVTLGALPAAFTDDYDVHVFLTNAEGKTQDFGAEDGFVHLLWLPLLPVNVLCSVIGTGGSLDVQGWEHRKRACVDRIVAHLMAEIQSSGLLERK